MYFAMKAAMAPPVLRFVPLVGDDLVVLLGVRCQLHRDLDARGLALGRRFVGGLDDDLAAAQRVLLAVGFLDQRFPLGVVPVAFLLGFDHQRLFLGVQPGDKGRDLLFVAVEQR